MKPRTLYTLRRLAMAPFWRKFHHDGKISPGWWGWGVPTAHPPPFTLSTITHKVVVVYAPAERADTLPLFLLYPYMYSGWGKLSNIPWELSINMKDGWTQRESKKSKEKVVVEFTNARERLVLCRLNNDSYTYTVTVSHRIPPGLLLPWADIHTVPYTAKLGVFCLWLVFYILKDGAEQRVLNDL